MARIVRRETAKRDVVARAVYLAEHGGVTVANRFMTAVNEGYQQLSRMPEIGAPVRIRKGKFAGVRIWPVPGFRNYLIIYRPLADGVEIARVIHAAQNYQRILS